MSAVPPRHVYHLPIVIGERALNFALVGAESIVADSLESFVDGVDAHNIRDQTVIVGAEGIAAASPQSFAEAVVIAAQRLKNRVQIVIVGTSIVAASLESFADGVVADSLESF